MTRSAFLQASVVLLLGLGSCSAPSHSHPALEATREFYAWYVPIANGHKHPGPAAGAVIEQRPQLLTPELASALRADVEAQAKGQDIVGLVGNFDPILNTQAPCAHYEYALQKTSESRALVRVRSLKENECGGDESLTLEWRSTMAAGRSRIFATHQKGSSTNRIS